MENLIRIIFPKRVDNIIDKIEECYGSLTTIDDYSTYCADSKFGSYFLLKEALGILEQNLDMCIELP